MPSKFVKGLERMLAGVARGSPPKVVEIFQKSAGAPGGRVFPPPNDGDDKYYWGRWDWGKTLDDGSRMLKYQANNNAQETWWKNMAAQRPHKDISWAVIPPPGPVDPSKGLEMLRAQFLSNYMTDPASHKRAGKPQDEGNKKKKAVKAKKSGKKSGKK